MGWVGSEETPPPAPGGEKRDLRGVPIPGAGVLGASNHLLFLDQGLRSGGSS